MSSYDIINPIECIPVVAYKLNGDFVGKYPNILDAAFKLSIPYQSINKMIKGKVNRVGKYVFIKEQDYVKGVKITYASIKRKRNFIKQKQNIARNNWLGQ